MHLNRHPISLVSLGFATGLALGLGGCRFSEPDPDHCARRDGNADCVEKFGDERPYCMLCGEPAYYNDGCAEREPEDLNCYSPCGDMQTYEEDASCLAVGDGDGDPGDGDGDGDPGDGDGEPALCMADEDCADAAMPFCEVNSGMCVACDVLLEADEACASLGDGSTPVCLEGTCVQCAEGQTDACQDTTPICDAAANNCVGCDAHEQCPDSACNMAAGNCIDPANILHVDGGFINCNSGDGSEAMPYCTLNEGLVNSPSESLIMIYAKPGQASYQEANTVSNTRAIFGVPDMNGDPPILQGFNNSPALTVALAGNLFLQGVQASASPAEGLLVSGGGSWVEQSRFINNTGSGITVESGGTLVLENSFMGGQTTNPALDVVDGTVDVVYSSLGLTAGFATPALRCSANGSGKIRNSIILTSNGSEVDCAGISIETSALGQAMGDNAALGALDVDWFIDYPGGDLHLSGIHPPALETAAVWMTGDPAQDIDGDARPTMADTPDVAGADIP